MILYLDCSCGIAGDMVVAALLAAARDRDGDSVALEAQVGAALAAIGIDAQIARAEAVTRGGFAALRFKVADGPGFATFADIDSAVHAAQAAGALDPVVAADVLALTARMAAAERAVHGGDEQHLHELASVDTAVDLLATALLVRALAPGRIIASPPLLGSGTVETAHGLMPVPPPAVLALVKGLPTAGGGTQGGAAVEGATQGGGGETLGELTTPTGAALLAHFAVDFGPLPAGRIVATGYGAGVREVPGRANVVRAVLIEESVAAPGAFAAGTSSEQLTLLETAIDDMSAELLAHAADELRAAGAIDVWLTAALMKKGRPGTVVHVLARSEQVAVLTERLFVETTTFGVRVLPVARTVVDERREAVAVDGQVINVRLALVAGRVVTASPEFEDCRRAAGALGRQLQDVYAAAQAAAQAL
jgi:uncharacterized protein (TIGR00299 family) protein